MPIVEIAYGTVVLVVNADLPATTVREVPTMSEAGITGYESATNYTLFAPTGLAREIVERLKRESNAVLQMAEVREKLLSLGIVVAGGSVDAVEKRVPSEMEKWARVIKSANLKFD